MYVENRTKIANFHTPVYLTPPLMGFPLEFCIGAGVTENQIDGAFRWSKKFSDRFSGFDTIPECDSQPPSHPASQPACHVAVAITLNAKASSLKTKKCHKLYNFVLKLSFQFRYSFIFIVVFVLVLVNEKDMLSLRKIFVFVSVSRKNTEFTIESRSRTAPTELRLLPPLLRCTSEHSLYHVKHNISLHEKLHISTCTLSQKTSRNFRLQA